MRRSCSSTSATSPRATPASSANNHPIRHGSVVGVHNGIIENDDELFEQHRIERAHPEMTVDSEIIFALAELARGRTAEALQKLYGSMATAWLDEGRPELLLARGLGRPLWLGRGKHELFFASTRVALQLVESYAAIKLRKSAAARGHGRRGRARQDRRAGALPAGPFVPGRAAARSAGSGRGPFVPRTARPAAHRRRVARTLRNVFTPVSGSS